MALSDMPSRVLVTGGGGFVGRHLIAALDQALPPGSEILAGSSSADGTKPDGWGAGRVPVRVVELDITDARQVGGVIRAEQPTHLVHLAAIAAVTASNRDPRHTWNVNLSGTLNVALAVADECPGCRIAFSSSAEVYGASFKAGVPLDETAALQPVNPYASSKAAADLMLGQMALQGLKVARLRPFNHTGPGQTEHFAIPSFAAQIARIERGLQEPVIRVGHLDSMRDFLDVQDVVAAYVATVLRADDLPVGCVMNLSSGTARRIGDMLDALLALSDTRIEVVPDPARFRPSDTPLVVGDSGKARTLLEWRPERDIDYTLASVLGYWRALVSG
ncbi:GDP-6-deoxy-D-lyxo-4-hexulose reductase [Skermanella stibiiresistens SB22]|uniref:GDP-6-deoxy-D-lyxo-4-hexulose reductase n=1 Tax=Skermanella stibiiresistens SB22 TaxID=1385369 RepID=W9H531_9PROT|nr:GDP-mannose 4,6-dehydratase [Skermanella stibiiresistens]EWY41345.1 GDP-6-deoxy-D-lyxo-4-hexulose reductase [Skermanella stibiiresistens SB22]